MIRDTEIARAVTRVLLASAAAAASLTYPTLSVAAEPQADEPIQTVTVTGSIIRRTETDTPSPITVVSSEALEERGLNTIAEAVQRLSFNNAGTIQSGWNTGFNFASGANAPALRGLTVQATLSMADGMRLAPYPLADDGQRNFVDLNAIPSAIIDRIEVLRDGASSTYGADAIAGVVNIITKKEIQGLHLGGATGYSEAGGGGERRADVTWGFGSLADQGYNFYVSGEYQKQNTLWARDRGYPFNSLDWTGVCGPTGSCMLNNNWNGVTAEDGSFAGLDNIPGVSLVRPVPTGVNVGEDRFAFLNAAAGCREWNTITLSPDLDTISPPTTCEVNQQAEYIMLQPEIERMGVSSRFTLNLNDDTQFYAMANFYQTDTFASQTPQNFNGRLPAPNAVVANVILPTHVCSGGTGTFNGLNTGCDQNNGTENPYNPYAAAGQRAEILLRSPFGRSTETSGQAMRGVLGLEGSFGDSWNFTANFTASRVELERLQGNFPIPQRIWDLAARGQFNFSDPYANSQEVWDFVAPLNRTDSLSKLWQVQGAIGQELWALPGGPLQAAVGVAYRDESIDAPSANPQNDAAPFSRPFSINAVGAQGQRDVKSGFFEINAPVMEKLELLGSGRYDEYSTGQSSFAPKLGFKATPIEPLAIRGTWSQGFRIPSFNEAFGLPTTGFVTRNVDCDVFPAFCAAHGNNSYVRTGYSLGLTQTGNPLLDPEESDSYTLGLVVQPLRNLSLTLDFWRIKVEKLITGVTDTSDVEAAYYANNGVVDIPGFNVIPGTPDAQFPNALPVIGFIETSYRNQDQQTVSGIDFGANLTVPVGRFDLHSYFELSYLDKYELLTDGGDTLNYAGTLSPCNITSCSGAPQWRGSFQNTVEFDNRFGKSSVSLTTYYTSGYDTASIDFGGTEGDCVSNARGQVSTQIYIDGSPVNCSAKAQWNADMTLRHRINENYLVQLDVLNVFDIEPEFDPSAAYTIFGYNPAWGGPNMMGRFYRFGIKVDL